MDLTAFTLLLVLALALANGTNDVSKAIATLVGSGVTTYRAAIVWKTLWTMIGGAAAAFVSTAMVKTFSSGFIQANVAIPSTLAPAILIGAFLWILLASKTGLPVSTTHALTGSLVGAGLMAFGNDGLIWSPILKKITLPLLLSPFLALGLSLFVHPLSSKSIATRWEGVCVCLMPNHRALVTIDAQGHTRTLFQAGGMGIPIAAIPSQCERAGLSGPSVGFESIH